MRIERVEVERLGLRLREPYTIAYETVDTAENLLVRLILRNGNVALGVSAPDAGVTGETLEASFKALQDIAVRIKGMDAYRRIRILEVAQPILKGCPAALAALDQALFDAIAKAANLPAWKLLGGYRRAMPTSITLFLAPPDEVVRRALDYRSQGFQVLKIKGGDVLELDIERIVRVREAVGPDVELLFDANQGYDMAGIRAFFDAVRGADLSIIEQPTPPSPRNDSLRGVTNALPLPIMADESLLDLDDALHIVRGEIADMVNIKLAKVGGLDQATMINGVARAGGLEVMVGCMDECALSIAAGLAFALSRPNVEYADLDGHLDLLNDPTTAALKLEDGVLYPSREPGFGIADV
ncbi:MAG: dipeptide epimerase [Myxococcales bacterium]|nr:dipeptide epimerase [Myxococcales bacterium]